ncbi:MAG: hypothetical protein WD708_06870 [Kiritimatiellia bacterium]
MPLFRPEGVNAVSPGQATEERRPGIPQTEMLGPEGVRVPRRILPPLLPPPARTPSGRTLRLTVSRGCGRSSLTPG